MGLNKGSANNGNSNFARTGSNAPTGGLSFTRESYRATRTNVAQSASNNYSTSNDHIGLVVGSTGTYYVFYNVNCESAPVKFKIFLNDNFSTGSTGAVFEDFWNDSADAGRGQAGAVILDLKAGDEVRLLGARAGGSGVKSFYGMSLNAIKLA